MPCALYRTWAMRMEDADEVCFLSSFRCVVTVTVTAWYLGGYAILNAYLPMRISSPCLSSPHTLLGPTRWLSGILVFFVLAKVYVPRPVCGVIGREQGDCLEASKC